MTTAPTSLVAVLDPLLDRADDGAGLAVLVDWLREQDDPRGDLDAALADPSLRYMGVEAFRASDTETPWRTLVMRIEPLARAVGLSGRRRSVDTELVLLPADVLGEPRWVVPTISTFRLREPRVDVTGVADATPGWLAYVPHDAQRDAPSITRSLVSLATDDHQDSALTARLGLGSADARLDSYPECRIPRAWRTGSLTVHYCQRSGARTDVWLPPDYPLWPEYLQLPHRVAR